MNNNRPYHTYIAIPYHSSIKWLTTFSFPKNAAHKPLSMEYMS